MRFLKRLFILCIVLFFVWYFVGNTLFNACITYKIIGSRTQYGITNYKLKAYLDQEPITDNSTIEQIIEQTLDRCSSKLSFTFRKCEVDPNRLIATKQANCMGYAAFASATCNYYIKKNEKLKHWEARPVKGNLFLFGLNIHNYIKSSFFKNHDFVILENTLTKEYYTFDPSLNDYLRIKKVRLNCYK